MEVQVEDESGNDILIVDDSRLNLNLLKVLLHESGYKVRSAETGEAAIIELKKLLPALILLDVKMPGMDGFEVCRRLKADETTSNIPVIFISAFDDEASRVKGFEAGGNDFINIPIHKEELLARVNNQFKLSRLQLEWQAQNSRLRKEIEQREKAEKALSDSEERFRLLFEKAPMGYQSLDANGLFIEVNQQWLDTLGYTREEIIGKWFGDFLPPAYQDGFRKRFPIFKQKGEIHSEFEMIHKNGSLLFIAFDGKISYDSSGTVKQTHCILQNITETKLAEQALMNSQSLLRGVLDGSQSGIMAFTSVRNSQGSIVDFEWIMINKAAENLVGKTSENLIGRKLLDIMPGNKEEGLFDMYVTVVETGNTLHHEHYYNHEHVRTWFETVAIKKDDGFVVTFSDISDRKHAAIALKNSEEKFRLLAENSPSIIYRILLKPEMRFDYVSPSVTAITGYTPEDHYADPQLGYKLVHPDDRNLLEDTSRLGNGEPLVLRWVKKDGNIIWTEQHNVIIFDQNNQPIAIEGEARDISERVKADEALKKSEENHRHLLQNLHAGVVVHAADTSILYANNQASQLLGLSFDQLLGKTAIDPSWHFIQADLTPLPFEQYAVQYVIDNQIPLRELVLGRILPGTDELFWALANAFPEFNTDGSLRQVVVTFIDITELKLVEAELKIAKEKAQESEAKFREMAELLPQIVFESDMEGKLTYVNKQAYRITGYSERDSLIGESSLNFYIPEDRTKAVENIKLSLAGKPNVEGHEYTMIKKDGTLLNVLVYSNPIIRDNKPVGLRGIIVDITEIKQAQEKIKEHSALIRIAAEKAKLGGWNVDLKENRSYWSDGVAAIHEMPAGYSPLVEEGINFYTPEWHERITKVFTDCAKNGIPYDEEMEIFTSTGKRVWVRTIGEAVRNENGKIFKVEGAFQDISEKKMAEAKIREKDIQFRKLSANVPDLIYQFTRKPDGTYCVPVASEGIKNIFGCSPEDVIEDFTPIANVIFHEDAARVISDIEYSAKHLSYFTCEFRVKIPGKEIQWIYSRSSPEKLPDGSITWYGFNVNITERKQAEEERVKLFRIIENSLNEIYMFNSVSLKFEFVNHGALQNIGYTLDEMKELTPFDIKPEFTESEFREKLEVLITNEKKSLYFSTIHRRKNGSTYPVDVHLQLFNQENKKVFFAIITDITIRKQAEEKILDQLNELRRWNEALLNREERVLDLKREVNTLLLAEGKAIRYASASDTAGDAGQIN